MKRTVVSFADGVGSYAKALMRLEQSLKQVEFDGNFKGINDYGHIGSPLHKGHPNCVPYAFKALSIKKAIDEGAELLLWCDSVVYATKSLNHLFTEIRQKGYIFFDNVGFSIGDYTSDNCLRHFGMSREESFNSKMIMACVMGFDVTNPQTKKFLDKYISAALDGISYHGDWHNNNLQVSQDMRVKGHRHDQSVASVLIKQMGLDITHAQSTYFAYSSHKGLVPISDKVCLWSEGI
ncbi:MAG TPA: hypothetical protein VFF27_00205 [Bacteroidia bacterium]|jgi:hypothetical protein|nr:hypothetical protein [Bacteroidia bacterium]